ncbi:MAG: DUF393 domain-containing protein [Candidatus Krumholzibacteria bacterium]|nr:DUF393 domain-containing protein [Candidatus Krumholzibacteria bacterium]
MPKTPVPDRTQPPREGAPVILYDGRCHFCTAHARRLVGGGGRPLALRSFHQQGVLEEFPGVTHEACMKEIKLIDADGHVYGGAEAVVRAVFAKRPWLGWMFFVYYIPGFRCSAEWFYARVAKNRYGRGGRTGEECETGDCTRHSSPD